MKHIIYLITVLFICFSVYAEIDYSQIPTISNDNIESVINKVNINSTIYESNFLFIPLSLAIPAIPTPIVGGGGGSPELTKKVSTIYYDVILSLDKNKYLAGDTMVRTVVIINKGYEPDRDGILTLYLEDPTTKIFRNESYTFELIPPTCINGIYNQYTDKCNNTNGTITDSLKWVKTYNTTIPSNSTIGEWQAYIKYQSNVQDEITTHVPFEVITKSNFFIVLLLILVGVGIYLYLKKKKGY